MYLPKDHIKIFDQPHYFIKYVEIGLNYYDLFERFMSQKSAL